MSASPQSGRSAADRKAEGHAEEINLATAKQAKSFLEGQNAQINKPRAKRRDQEIAKRRPKQSRGRRGDRKRGRSADTESADLCRAFGNSQGGNTGSFRRKLRSGELCGRMTGWRGRSGTESQRRRRSDRELQMNGTAREQRLDTEKMSTFCSIGLRKVALASNVGTGGT